MTLPVILIGFGGHAKVLIEILQLLRIPIVGATDIVSREELSPHVTLLGNDEIILQYKTDSIRLVNGLGSVDSTRRRKMTFERWSKEGYSFATLAHPSATISSNAQIHDGAQIMAGAIIQAGSRIGENTIINTGASVDHDCDIGSHVHLAPGVTLSGKVTVGDETHIGTGAIIIQGIRVGINCLVGAGSVVLDNIPDRSVVYGNPARVVKTLG